MVPEHITTGGWVLNNASVASILPQVRTHCSSLALDAPVVIYCLDNSSFCCADNGGVLSPVKKGEDGIFHVIGEPVAVYKVTMAAAVTNLKRILAACSDRLVLIMPFSAA
jgi:hypothetical protein